MSPISNTLQEHLQETLEIQITDISVIGHGAHNQNHLLDTNKGKLILRIYANTQFENAEKEYRILQKLDGLLGPKAYYLDTTKKLLDFDYIVLDYIEGDVIKEFTDQNLVDIAGILRQLHQIKYKKDSPGLISDWTRNNITKNAKNLDQETQRKIRPLWNKLLKLHDEIQHHIKDHSPDSLIHDDPILGNFIQTQDGVKLIDWELAHGNYSFIELGGFIEENGLTPKQEKIFLQAYGYGVTTEALKVLTFCKAYRITAIVGWFIERIVMLNSGDKVFINADKVEYENNLNKEIKHLERLLR